MTSRRRMRVIVGVDEIFTNRDVWRGLMAEFLGTFLLVLVACGACVDFPVEKHPSRVQIALAFGFTVASLVQCIGHTSGGHINPAVTCAMLITGKIPILRSVFYVITQCVGSMVGAAVVKALTHEIIGKEIGVTKLHNLISSVQGFGVEFLITFVLVLTVFAVCDVNRSDLKGSGPMAIGIAVTACHLFAIPYTGSSMNPARSFGPAMMANCWENHWIYWIAPCLGGMAAAIFYEWVLQTKESSAEPVQKNKIYDELPLMGTNGCEQEAATKKHMACKTTAI